MNKIPMQVYLDPEMVTFYKEYARSQGKSFAELIREIMEDGKEQMSIHPKKTQKKHPLLQAFKKARKQLKNIKYHYKDLTDDELLYTYAR